MSPKLIETEASTTYTAVYHLSDGSQSMTCKFRQYA